MNTLQNLYFVSYMHKTTVYNSILYLTVQIQLEFFNHIVKITNVYLLHDSNKYTTPIVKNKCTADQKKSSKRQCHENKLSTYFLLTITVAMVHLEQVFGSSKLHFLCRFAWDDFFSIDFSFTFLKKVLTILLGHVSGTTIKSSFSLMLSSDIIMDGDILHFVADQI